MKKNCSLIQKSLFVSIILLVIQQSIRSQVPEPAEWGTFVGSTKNISIRDTFRFQTFEETQRDNWKYDASEGCILFDASAEGIKGQGGLQSLKLPLGSHLSFEHYSRNNHKDVRINIVYGGISLMPKEDLYIKAYRDPENAPIRICEANNPSTIYHIKSQQVQSNPPGIDITASSKASDSKTGYYCVDSVYAFGEIPLYTHFSTSGTWNDTTRWSHLPAARHRNALISGHASIDTDMQCNDLHIGDGSVVITQNSHSIVNNITLYYTDILLNNTNILLKSSGKLTVGGKVTVKRTFTERGKWYFISFPFDIYPDGIDAGFQLKDETYAAGGNAFYLKTYNGEKRATSNTNQGNWETLSAAAINSNQPIFRKNKGYLIALDATATSQTLSFSSKEANIPTDFGKNGTIPIQSFLSQNQTKNEHSGWYLCGNPLSSTLNLSQIELNPSLDGNIYIYDGSSYTAYAIGSNYTLPPFAAFFVKASRDTELKISPIPSPASEYLLSGVSLPIRQLKTEPSADFKTSLPPQQAINCQIIGSELHLSNLSTPGTLRILDFKGLLVYSGSVAAGTSVLSLSQLNNGLYVLDIKSGNYRTQQKFIRK